MPRTPWLLVVGLIGCATASSSGTPARGARSPAEGSSAQLAVVAIPNARNPMPGVVTGGVPSEADLEQAKRLGYHTVVSLLPEDESQTEARRVTAMGLRFVSIPIRSADDLTESSARLLGEVLSAPDAKPLILHCASGNRAGALLALHAFYVGGQSAEQALALGEAAGLSKLRDAVETRLQAASMASPSEPQ